MPVAIRFLVARIAVIHSVVRITRVVAGHVQQREHRRPPTQAGDQVVDLFVLIFEQCLDKFLRIILQDGLLRGSIDRYGVVVIGVVRKIGADDKQIVFCEKRF